MDKLEEIFQMQYELNKRIGIDTAAMSDEEKVKWVLNYSRALGQENAELVDSVPWKWWAKYQKFDPQNARVEVVDMLHFLVSLAQVLGMSAQDFYDVYAKKNHINHDRQDSHLPKLGDLRPQGWIALCEILHPLPRKAGALTPTEGAAAPKRRAQGAPAVGASLLSVIKRRGYNRAFPRLVRIGFANYWRWDMS